MALMKFFYDIIILVIGILALYFGVQEIIRKKSYLIGGIQFSLKKNPLLFAIVVLFKVIIGIAIIGYFAMKLF